MKDEEASQHGSQQSHISSEVDIGGVSAAVNNISVPKPVRVTSPQKEPSPGSSLGKSSPSSGSASSANPSQSALETLEDPIEAFIVKGTDNILRAPLDQHELRTQLQSTLTRTPPRTPWDILLSLTAEHQAEVIKILREASIHGSQKRLLALDVHHAPPARIGLLSRLRRSQKPPPFPALVVFLGFPTAVRPRHELPSRQLPGATLPHRRATERQAVSNGKPPQDGLVRDNAVSVIEYDRFADHEYERSADQSIDNEAVDPPLRHHRMSQSFSPSLVNPVPKTPPPPEAGRRLQPTTYALEMDLDDVAQEAKEEEEEVDDVSEGAVDELLEAWTTTFNGKG